MGWAGRSPRRLGVSGMVRYETEGPAVDGGLAFEHVLDEDAALGDFLVDDELFIIGGDEEDHCYFEWLERRWRWRRRGKGDTTAERK